MSRKTIEIGERDKPMVKCQSVLTYSKITFGATVTGASLLLSISLIRFWFLFREAISLITKTITNAENRIMKAERSATEWKDRAIRGEYQLFLVTK